MTGLRVRRKDGTTFNLVRIRRPDGTSYLAELVDGPAKPNPAALWLRFKPGTPKEYVQQKLSDILSGKTPLPRGMKAMKVVKREGVWAIRIDATEYFRREGLMGVPLKGII
jgi:hypothetical protein